MISFLPGCESSEVSEACALRYIVHPAMPAETAASVIQMANHAPNVFCCEATSAANSAVRPMTTCPQPGTAVKAEARSIVSRMKRRLSIARSWSAGGPSSARPLSRNVWTTAMPPPKIHPPATPVKCFAKQSNRREPDRRGGVRPSQQRKPSQTYALPDGRASARPFLFVSMNGLNERRLRREILSQQNVTPPDGVEFVAEGEGVREFRLANGMKLLLAENRVAPVATFLVLYRVGSRNEAVGHTGATHLLEHMLFKGTPTFNKAKGTQVAATLQRVGADFNATTWYDRTNYFETVPSDALELAVHLEADRMRNSFIADDDRRSEMTVVRNELERGQNEPMLVLDEAVYATAFREHPYHHPTIGWRSDVENVPTARLKEFYDTFYHPNNATAVVVGDFEEGRALSLVNRYFGAFPASP